MNDKTGRTEAAERDEALRYAAKAVDMLDADAPTRGKEEVLHMLAQVLRNPGVMM